MAYETSEKKMSSARIAFALLCGLAVCCSVMYITADGSDEFMHETITSNAAAIDAGTSVGTTDVLKAGQIYTETPDGRMRLMDYFTNVEQEIADEVASRKKDIASVRAKMARDFAFNAASRASLKKQMMHQMAVNAKKARDDLNKAMRKTQERMAKQASLANRRYKATLKRDKKTEKVISKDKAASARALKMAVSAWQKSTTAWASSTNARIDRMNKHAAANAAAISENAKKARKDLEKTMHAWDHKIATFREESKNARSKLSEQFKQQDKATRAWANNKIKGLVAGTASQFNDVQTKMAKNRHEIDMALKQASMRFMAALNSAKALEDKRFASNVADIAAAKREANEKVDAATSEFKVGLLTLSSTVKEQVQKVNSAIDDTAGVVRSNAAAQAKVNANINAEMTRMVKLGNDNYKKHLKDDEDLQAAINKDKSDTDSEMNAIALDFNQKLADVRSQLAKDRKHAEDQLGEQTKAVYAQLAKNEDAQKEKNTAMAAATRRMKLDAMDNLRKAKEDFRKKIADLGEVVAKNDKEADKKIEDLTGVVVANAAKAKKGREILASLEEANKLELHAAIQDAIKQGEKRAQAVEEKGKKMDADTRFAVTSKLNAEITKLRDETNASVEKLALLNKEAREEMRKEMLYAIRSAAKQAKTDLDDAVATGVKKMTAYEEKAAASADASEEARSALKTEIADNAAEVTRMIKDAVDTDARAQASLRQQTAAAIKKTNDNISAYSVQMMNIADDTRDAIIEQTKKTLADVADEAQRASKATGDFSAEDAARQKAAVTFLTEQLKIASEESEKKFGAAYKKLAGNRAEAENNLATATKGINDSLAKQAALADERFSKTVTDIAVARKEAADQVAGFRKAFGQELILVTAEVKNVNQQLMDNLYKVTAEVQSMKAAQKEINRKTSEDLNRIEELSNQRHTESKTARGKLRQLMDENKRAAAAEVESLRGEMRTKIDKLRSKNAANRRAMSKDLTHATEKFYEKLSAQVKSHEEATTTLDAATQSAANEAARQLKNAQTGFDAKLVQMTNTVVEHAGKAKREMASITGVVNDFATASAADRLLIQEETRAVQADLQKALDRAVAIGEAKAKAVAQRLAMHLKSTKSYLMVELNNQVEAAADLVMNMIEGKRQKIADNYLSLKAYSVASADDIEDYVVKGKGKGLSAIGDLLVSVAGMGAVQAPPAEGLGMGSGSSEDGKLFGDTLPSVFSGNEIKVSNAVAAINGLVNEYTDVTSQVMQRWPMGLGRYLMDKLQISMQDKGVLQVDKVEGKSGNFVYMNGRSVGLSNKLSDFSDLAASMNAYESVLAQLTAVITKTPPQLATPEQMFYAPAGVEWEGN